MSEDELSEHMRKVRAGEIKPMPEPERTEYLFTRWRSLLERLADSERRDMEAESAHVRECPACHAARRGRMDRADVLPHIGCYYA